MEIPIFRDFIVLFCLAIAVLLVCHKVRIPSIVGFLVTGVLSGPYALGLVKGTTEVEIVAKIGVVLLLFTIGAEFSLKQAFRYKRYFLFGGTLQIVLTTISGFLIAKVIGRPFGEAIFLGFLLSLSSTAIVLRLFDTRHEHTTSYARLSTAILIFQDLMVVPMMLFVPVLAGKETDVGFYLLLLLAKGLLLVFLVIYLATKIVPKLFYYIVQTHIRELFILAVLAVCFSVTALSDWLGLSLSIGAFLAGLIISESEYRYQAIGDMVPIQDIFTSIFFVSIGMLLDVEFLLAHLPLIALMLIGVMFLKWSLIAASGMLIGVPLRTVFLGAFSICQIGEFSFVLAKEGLNNGIGTNFYYQLFLSIAILSMGITPFLIQYSHKLVEFLMQLPFPARIISGQQMDLHSEEKPPENHVVIVGYGILGQYLAAACKKAGIQYVIVDINAKIVHSEKEKGEPILFGDATHEVILKKLHIENAKAISVAINDPIASIRIIQVARKLHPSLYILCRTHYLEEAKVLFEQGADEVIPDELGSSIEMFSRVLHYFHVPQDEIERLAVSVQDASYEIYGTFKQ